jgi:hypothetical protein
VYATDITPDQWGGDGEGHRISALQRFAADLGFTPGEVKTLTDAHTLRNARTYRAGRL